MGLTKLKSNTFLHFPRDLLALSVYEFLPRESMSMTIIYLSFLAMTCFPKLSTYSCTIMQLGSVTREKSIENLQGNSNSSCYTSNLGESEMSPAAKSKFLMDLLCTERPTKIWRLIMMTACGQWTRSFFSTVV